MSLGGKHPTRFLKISSRWRKKEASPSAGISVTIRWHGKPKHGPLLQAIHRIMFRLDVEAVDDVPGWWTDDREPDEETRPEKPRRPHPVRWSGVSLAALRALCHCVESLSYMRTDRAKDENTKEINNNKQRAAQHDTTWYRTRRPSCFELTSTAHDYAVS